MAETPLSPLITRHAISRLAAQLFDRSGRLLGPVITTMKVLLSRSCEIMSYDELDMPIQEKDKEFSDLIVRVLESCKNWKSIMPLEIILYGDSSCVARVVRHRKIRENKNNEINKNNNNNLKKQNTKTKEIVEK